MRTPLASVRWAERRNGGSTIHWPGFPRNWNPKAPACCSAGAAAPAVLRGLAEETEAGTLLWNRGHGLAERTVDAAIKEWATGQGITATAAERYPAPLVGLQESRARALDAYRQLKDG